MARRAVDESTGGGKHRHDAIDTLVRVAFTTMAVLNRVAAENDLSLTQLRVLGILRDRRARMAELADFLGLDKSTMTGLVARAEQRGLLVRGPGATDGRVVEVTLGREGTKLVPRLEAQVRQGLAPMMDRLTAAEQRRVQGLLERMLGDDDQG
jgi:DNA-binding MarR family transcriptional regulator